MGYRIPVLNPRKQYGPSKIQIPDQIKTLYYPLSLLETRKTQPSGDTHTSAASLSNPHFDFPSNSSGEHSTLSRTSVPGRNDACSNVDGMSGALSTKVGTIK